MFGSCLYTRHNGKIIFCGGIFYIFYCHYTKINITDKKSIIVISFTTTSSTLSDIPRHSSEVSSGANGFIVARLVAGLMTS